jgi:predicted AlkP superfamily phosphohydrolase/phosphomutase
MSDERKTRVLVIGLDGATFRVIRPMVAAGELPVLSRLLAGGAHGVLRSTIQPSSEQAWTTFMTGVQNGKHGIFGFVQRASGSYEYQYTNALSRRAPTIWRILSERGRRVICINMPLTYPPEPVNGVLVGGLMSPSERSRFTYPDGIYDELRRAIGGYIIDVDIETGRLKDAGEAQLLSALDQMTHWRTEAAKYLGRTRAWDVLCVVYGSTDRVSHKFWKYMEQGGDKAGIIPQVYRRLDAAIGELLDAFADERTIALLVSDHGFGPLKKALFLNQWLAEHGYLVWKEPQRDARARLRAGFNQALRRAVRWLDRPWVGAAKRALFATWPGLKGKLHSSMAYAAVDWSRTRAYGSGTMGNIYLNVRGREPAGIVTPGIEYEALRSEIIAGLAALRDPEDGRPVFEAVYRREDIYHGPCLELAPDIVGLLDPTYHVAAVDWRPAGGAVIAALGDQLLFVGDLTGQHDMEGILIAHGPNIRVGAEVQGAGIIDMAPTILALLGEPIPADMDGRVLQQIFERPLAVAGGAPAGSDVASAEAGDGYSDAEADEIAARLRGLGYIN